MNNLKPCPFCGGEAELCYGPGLGTDSCRGYTLQASCNECCAKSPGLWQEKKPEPDDAIWKDAADEWNWRPGEESLKQLWSSNLDIIGGELNKQLVEARARLAVLERAHDSTIEEQAALCAEGQSITELVAAKDKLIEQMRDALKAIDAIGSEKGDASRDDALRCFSIARAALAAERTKL